MIWLIAKREIITRGRSRAFQVIIAIMFLAVIAAGVVPQFLDGDGEAREVTIGITADAVSLEPALAAGDDELDPTIVMVDAGDVTPIEDGDVDVIFDGTSLTWEGFPDLDIDDYVRNVAQQVAFTERAQALEIGQDDIATLFTEVDIDEVRLDGGEDDFAARAAVAGVTGFGTFMLLQIWGQFMTMGVIEEKSSRVVEILLSHVRPITLLGGKLLGLGILAFVQMVILVLGIVVALLFLDDFDVPSGVWGAVPLALVTFALGFGFYATAAAAAGSLVPRVEDASSVQFIAMMPLFVGYIIAFSTFSTPNAAVVTVGSFVPFFAPVLIPFREALVDPPLWQPILSLVFLAISTVVMLRIAGGIYRYSLLRTGSRVSFIEALRNRNSAEI